MHAPWSMCHDMQAEIRRQLVGVRSLLLLNTWVTGIELRLSSLVDVELVFCYCCFIWFCCCCCFEMGSYITQTGLKLAM